MKNLALLLCITLAISCSKKNKLNYISFDFNGNSHTFNFFTSYVQHQGAYGFWSGTPTTTVIHGNENTDPASDFIWIEDTNSLKTFLTLKLEDKYYKSFCKDSAGKWINSTNKIEFHVEKNKKYYCGTFSGAIYPVSGTTISGIDTAKGAAIMISNGKFYINVD